MTRYAALLRGVNVGGHTVVPMSALRAVAARLTFANPRTLLQSGNLVFEAEGHSALDLERMLEDEIQRRIGVQTAVCVRSAATWARLTAANPFADVADADPSHLVLVAFKTPPKPGAPEALAADHHGPERVAVAEGHAYIVYPESIGRSKLTPALLGRHLGQGTARNWNTVLKLQGMLAED